jgi:endonuclease/exonuclease/phosphatase (EEP) superfamily protein YafD
MSRVQVVAIAWLALVIGLVALHAILPQRSGVIALTEVFEPYLLMSAIVAAVIAAASRYRTARALALVFLAVVLVRCTPSLISHPGDGGGSGGGEELRVMTWNVLADDAAQRTVDAVKGSDANLVGLQELQPDAASALESDLAISGEFPHSVLEPEGTVLGIGLLSAFPIVEHTVSLDPPYLRASVELSVPTVIYVVHPLPARIQSLGVPISLDTTKRDADIALIRGHVEADLAAGRPVIVMGDLNTTEREPAYADMSLGLKDAHLEAGLGPGLTWRLPSLSFLPFGLLRIDYVFADPSFDVTSTHVDCYSGSDHCAVFATIQTGVDR